MILRVNTEFSQNLNLNLNLNLNPEPEIVIQRLPWGGEFTAEALQFFSPALIWARLPLTDDVHTSVFDCFKEYLQVRRSSRQSGPLVATNVRNTIAICSTESNLELKLRAIQPSTQSRRQVSFQVEPQE